MRTPGHTLATLLDNHQIEDALDQLSPHLPGDTPTSHTRLAYLATLRSFLTWTDQQWRSVFHPDPTLAHDYLQHLAQTLSERSIKNHLSRLSRFYTILNQEQLVTPGTNPFTLITPPTLRASEARDAYTAEELQKLLEKADSSWCARLLLGAHGGLSKDQMIHITWQDIAKSHSSVSLYGRTVPHSRALRDALNTHAKDSGQGSLTQIQDRTSPLFEAMFEYILRRRLFGLCKRAGVPPLAWSGLRNHAILRTLGLENTTEVPQVIPHSKIRNVYIVRELKDQDVVQGPKRTRSQVESSITDLPVRNKGK